MTLIGANVTDDKWHTVSVQRRGNTVSLQLDFKAKAYATTGVFSDGNVIANSREDFSGIAMSTSSVQRVAKLSK